MNTAEPLYIADTSEGSFGDCTGPARDPIRTRAERASCDEPPTKSKGLV
jgi:hypothetical protein